MFLLLMVAVFLQPNAPRFYAAVCFLAITLSHEGIAGHLTGLAYYGSAALFDLLIIILTAGINPVPRMVLWLHRVCMVSIVANGIGWVMWYAYWPPYAYDATFIVIYLWALVTLLERDAADDMGGFTADSWASCFRFSVNPRAECFRKYGGPS